jgi:hypothetical protein
MIERCDGRPATTLWVECIQQYSRLRSVLERVSERYSRVTAANETVPVACRMSAGSGARDAETEADSETATVTETGEERSLF